VCQRAPAAGRPSEDVAQKKGVLTSSPSYLLTKLTGNHE
jgi:hypothetical protein